MTKEENEQRLQRLKNIVLNMPESPGSYQYYDADGGIIYVGKAKNLKRRVSSYFHKEVDRYKTKVLVSKIMDITYTVVKTEDDALLLEVFHDLLCADAVDLLAAGKREVNVRLRREALSDQIFGAGKNAVEGHFRVERSASPENAVFDHAGEGREDPSVRLRGDVAPAGRGRPRGPRLHERGHGHELHRTHPRFAECPLGAG